jgi:hypothetical protein
VPEKLLMSIMAAAPISLLYYNLLTLGKSELEDDEDAVFC